MKKYIFIIISCLIASSLLGNSVNGQIRKKAKKDTIVDFKTLTEKQVGKAFVRNLILPGWQQTRKKQYWKLPIIYGGLAYFGREAFINHNDYRDKYDEATSVLYNPPYRTKAMEATPEYQRLEEAYKDSRVKRNHAILGATAIYALSCLDASLTVKTNYHSPKKAAFLSMVIPGAGQIYNRQYLKAGIIYGLGYYVFYWNRIYAERYDDLVEAHNDFYDFKNGNYFKSDDSEKASWEEFYPGVSADDEVPSSANQILESLKRLRDSYRRNRDYTYIGLGAVYLLNILDASVYGHLFEWEMGEDLAANFTPTIVPDQFGRPIPGMGLAIRF